MNRTSGHRLLCATIFALLFGIASPIARADQWTVPTPEELSMTSQPEVPGASAVYLYREETTEDDLHAFSIYVRLKILTEAGKEKADVELRYASFSDGFDYTVNDVEGRTIHSDGTIVPFTGKPYQKLITKEQGHKVMAEVFSLPDVQVGSIIEYRYKIRYNDEYYAPPSWYIQSDLFTRKAHYVWKPTTRELSSDRGMVQSIQWFPILPAGASLQHRQLPPTGFNPPQQIFELSMDNVPPAPDEDFMPPITSLTYRVLFFYSAYRNGDEFWNKEGKRWSKERDKFIGPGHSVTAAVQELTAPSDTQDQKLRKIYAAVMKLENTDFTREHSTVEEKAEGFKETHNTDDVWERKRGDDNQLTELFVAMARAAGMKAYVFAVTNRDRNLFLKGYLSLGQLDDYLAIVNVDGKEQYFDPGSRYCRYQHLAWKHTAVEGLRQVDGGSGFGEAPMEPYTTSRSERVADLAIDEHGVVTGTVKLTFIGSPALAWRQESLIGDAASLDRQLRTHVENLLPQGMDIKVAAIEKLEDYEQPLVVNYTVSGPIGSVTGKRLFLPGDIFEANSKATFPHEKRDIPVYFNYPYILLDAVRIKYPPTFSMESAPTADKYQFKNYALYTLSEQSAPGSITVRRSYFLGQIIFLTGEYPDLRAFYSKMETKDQENVILTAAAKATTAAN